ncbi:glycosyltransferase family 9 protein [Candidatus Woesearchaeota archaeon]|nr:glycosyltransferase family 9 protein [Candidatus Woesearchaeota archaeon]
METLTKKILRFLRNLSWFLDYAIFRVTHLSNRKVPHSFSRILVIELDKIGDIMMTTPVIRALHTFYQVPLDVMVQPAMQDVLTFNPHVSKILPYGRPEIQQNFSKIVSEIKGKYDLAVILHPGNRLVSNLLREANIAYRVGCTRPGFFDGKGNYLNKKSKPNFNIKHKIQDNLDVIRTTLNIPVRDDYYEIYITKEDENFVKNLLDEFSINKKYIVLHAAPEYLSHCWNDEKFAKVADALIEKYNFDITFSGAKKDFVFNQKIISLMKHKAFNFAGKTNLKQFFALIRKSKLVVSVDTSAMHAAAAFNVPVVALFGEGDPRIWRPYSENNRLIFKEKGKCRSCGKWFGSDRVKHECMDLIKAEEVLDAVNSLLR